jgi:hypothetical protein
MSRPRGGITGFGYGNTLGGLLLGGVKKADMTASQLASYVNRLKKLQDERMAEAERKLATGEYKRTKSGAVIKISTGRKVKKGPAAHARDMLQRLIDAENKGADLLLADDHPDLAEYLDEDMAYNINLRDSGRRPKWLLDKYSGKSGRVLYPPVKPRAAMLSSEELQAAKEALKYAPVWEYTSKNGKTRKSVKEGSAEFKRIMAMKSVQDGEATFEPRAPFIRRDQYV